MVLLKLLDLVADMLSWRNLRSFATRTRLMWPITASFLWERRVRVLLMSLAVALGFSAYLTFQVVLGSNESLLASQMPELNLPTPMVIRNQHPILPPQIDVFRQFYVRDVIHALEANIFIGEMTGTLLGFGPEETFWHDKVSLIAGDVNLSPRGIALPLAWAESLNANIGDHIVALTSGNPGPLNQAGLIVEAIHTSEYALLDQPIALSSARAFQGHNIEHPTTLFVDTHPTNIRRMWRMPNVLMPPRSEDPYPYQYAWLMLGESTSPWILQTVRPYSLLVNDHGRHNSLNNMVSRIVSNNYSSGRFLVFLVFSFSALCVFNILLISLLTRRRDVGILKTIGYDDMSIFTNFILEGAIIAGTGIIIGGLASQLGFLIASRFTGYMLAVHWGQILRAGLLSFFIFLASSAIPADMARYTTVMELLSESSLRSSWEEDPLKSRAPRAPITRVEQPGDDS